MIGRACYNKKCAVRGLLLLLLVVDVFYMHACIHACMYVCIVIMRCDINKGSIVYVLDPHASTAQGQVQVKQGTAHREHGAQHIVRGTFHVFVRIVFLLVVRWIRADTTHRATNTTTRRVARRRAGGVIGVTTVGGGGDATTKAAGRAKAVSVADKRGSTGTGTAKFIKASIRGPLVQGDRRVEIIQ
jgi:hypothetical protein